MNKFLLASMAFAAAANVVCAQDSEHEDRIPPYNFVGLQGGVQNTFNKHFNNWKTFTPTASLSVGRFFNPQVGARLNVNGMWDKGSAAHILSGHDVAHWKYNYITPSADVLVNLCTTFGKKDYYPVNLYFIGGLGANYAWHNDEASDLYAQGYKLTDTDNESRWAFNGRVGLQLAYDICRHWGVNIESDLNLIAPGNTQSFAKDYLQLTCQAGVTYKFGMSKKHTRAKRNTREATDAVQAPVYETRIDTVWYNEEAVANRVENGQMTWNVFYNIRQSDFDAQAQLSAIGNFLKEHRACKVDVRSYADAGTGNPRVNLNYSRQRNEKAVKALVDAGVDASIITNEYLGDREQPFAENDKNRVTIISASGLKDVQDKTTVRKYRLEEKRVRVQ